MIRLVLFTLAAAAVFIGADWVAGTGWSAPYAGFAIIASLILLRGERAPR